VLRYIALKTEITFSKIYSVATFYALQSPTPRRKHCLHLPRQPCHTRGSRNLLQGVLLDLGLDLVPDDGGNNADKIILTTPYQKFTIRTVACFGQCALAPVVEVNHRMLNHVPAVVRAYDPCLSCSTHAFGQPALQICLVDPRGRILDQLSD
jgi:NADH-quinone oxidoreductase subunit E